jgi:hypothetical protein
MDSDNKRRCVKCNKEIEFFMSIANTNIAYLVVTKKPLYGDDDLPIGICFNEECPNNGLLQVGAFLEEDIVQ